MRYNHSTFYHFGLPAAVIGLGVLMLLPGGDAPPRASSVRAMEPRATPSYVAVSPDLLKQLDASLAPAVIDDAVAREASLPEPTIQTLEPPADRELTAAQKVPEGALIAAREAAESRTLEVPETAPRLDVAPGGALRVGDSSVNMRMGPSTKTGVIRTLNPGQALAMGETQRGWVSVRTEDGASGWVYSTYLIGPALAAAGLKQHTGKAKQVRQTAEASESRRETGLKRYARVESDTYLRAGPSRQTERVSVLRAGERVVVAEVRGRWARLVPRNGPSGWIRIK